MVLHPYIGRIQKFEWKMLTRCQELCWLLSWWRLQVMQEELLFHHQWMPSQQSLRMQNWRLSSPMQGMLVSIWTERETLWYRALYHFEWLGMCCLWLWILLNREWRVQEIWKWMHEIREGKMCWLSSSLSTRQWSLQNWRMLTLWEWSMFILQRCLWIEERRMLNS